MRKKVIYKTWVELSGPQRKQVVDKLAKLSKDEGEAYLKKPLMKYALDDNGNPTGGYLDPYLLSPFFSI